MVLVYHQWPDILRGFLTLIDTKLLQHLTKIRRGSRGVTGRIAISKKPFSRRSSNSYAATSKYKQVIQSICTATCGSATVTQIVQKHL